MDIAHTSLDTKMRLLTTAISHSVVVKWLCQHIIVSFEDKLMMQNVSKLWSCLKCLTGMHS